MMQSLFLKKLDISCDPKEISAAFADKLDKNGIKEQAL